MRSADSPADGSDAFADASNRIIGYQIAMAVKATLSHFGLNPADPEVGDFVARELRRADTRHPPEDMSAA